MIKQMTKALASGVQVDTVAALPEALDDVAQRVSRLRLQVPLLFLVEAHRPLSGILYNLSLFTQPFLAPVFGSHRIHLVQRLLEDPRMLDSFIERVESYSLAEQGETPSV